MERIFDSVWENLRVQYQDDVMLLLKKVSKEAYNKGVSNSHDAILGLEKNFVGDIPLEAAEKAVVECYAKED